MRPRSRLLAAGLALAGVAGCTSSSSLPVHRAGPAVRVTCAAHSGDVGADRTELARRAGALAHGGRATVVVDGSDAIVTVPGSTTDAVRSLCTSYSLSARPLERPAVPIGTGCARSTDAATRSTSACGGDLAYRLGPAIFTDGDLTDARAVAPQASRGITQWSVQLDLTGTAGRRWQAWTSAHNTGNNVEAANPASCGPATPCTDFVAFVLDGKVISVPVTASAIPASVPTQVTGTFTKASATSLAAGLAHGSLPVPLAVRSVTPIK